MLLRMHVVVHVVFAVAVVWLELAIGCDGLAHCLITGRDSLCLFEEMCEREEEREGGGGGERRRGN